MQWARTSVLSSLLQEEKAVPGQVHAACAPACHPQLQACAHVKVYRESSFSLSVPPL